MAFFKERSEFPPKDFSFWSDKYKEYATWYSGDIEELLKYYSTKLPTGFTQEESFFWQKVEAEERANVCHLPIAGDIAETSGNLLFAESPRIEYEKNNKAGEFIKAFLTENSFNSMMLEAAELATALSGCLLKLNFAQELSNIPILTILTPQQFFPVFLYGRLWEILSYRVIMEKNTSVWRLFENRKRKGKDLIVEFKLYKGTSDNIGSEIALNFFEETENLKDKVIKNMDSLGCVYVPNKRPNKLLPGSYLGANDYGSCISLMDGLDFAYSSWLNDIEIGLGQVFIDEELLTRTVDESLNGTSTMKLNKFSKFQRCFINLNYSNAKMGGDNIKPIDPVQFNIRVDEHLKTCQNFLSQIVSQCGYSQGTFGLEVNGRAESGTALRIRERKTFLTRNKKSRYWQTAIQQILIQAQKMEIALTLNNYTTESPTVELEDSIIFDSREQSETIRNLDQARAISTLTKVSLQHPDWSEKEIIEEVDRINKEQGITDEIFNNET